MRSAIILSAFAALALAAPRPQDIEFDLVDASPDPDIVTVDSSVTTTDTVPVQPVAEAVAVASAAVTDVASTTDPSQKRDFLELTGRNPDCAAEPAGSGQAVTK